MTALDAADDHSNILSMTGISKSFPGVQSLKRVDFSAKGGEIHALVGENGAGKSTLTKIISGAYVQDEGEITLNGSFIKSLFSFLSSPSPRMFSLTISRLHG